MPWPCAVEFHACCYKESFFETLQDATALRRGVSRLLLTSTTRKAVASEEFQSAFPVAANVRLHPTRGWHLQKLSRGLRFLSSERETPRRKAVAS